MERHLERVIRRALGEARDDGLDYPGQTHRAIREILRSRPDLTDTEARAAIDHVRRDLTA